MSWIDNEFKLIIHDVLERGVLSEKPRGYFKFTGKPAYSRYITQVKFDYNLEEGEFPLTQLRPVPWKSAIREILTIYQTQSSLLKDYQKNNVTWWDDWMIPFNSTTDVVEVPYKEIDNSLCMPIVEPKLTERLPSLDGKEYTRMYEDKYEDKFIITKEVSDTHVEIQYLLTGTLLVVPKHRVERETTIMVDPNRRYFYGVGYFGDYWHNNNFSSKQKGSLMRIWLDLLRKCYGLQRYTKVNHKMHRDWHCFDTFLTSVKNLPNVDIAISQGFSRWSIDIYHGGVNFGEDTCVFIPTKNLKDVRYPCKVTRYEGDSKFYLSLENVAKDLGCSLDTVKDLLDKGNAYSFLRIETYNNPSKVLRYDISQISHGTRYGATVKKYDIMNKLLKGLEDNPWNRRNVINLWQYEDFKETDGLAPCAFQVMFDVRKVNDKIYLDCSLIQRSSDMLVALHINQIQYVALQMMIACHFGWEVGKFSHFVNNLHIYVNQYPQAKVLMETTLRKGRPRLKLACPKGTNFYDIKIEDFYVENYNPTKNRLKFDLAI